MSVEMEFTEKLGIPEYEFRLILGRTKIEYDENKEHVNREKHKYSLESASHFFERLMLPVPHPPFISSDAFVEHGEIRHMHMSVGDSGEVVFLATTMRDDEIVRVISFRRANDKEEALFHEHTGYNK